jgi:hypothetical protein
MSCAIVCFFLFFSFVCICLILCNFKIQIRRNYNNYSTARYRARKRRYRNDCVRKLRKKCDASKSHHRANSQGRSLERRCTRRASSEKIFAPRYILCRSFLSLSLASFLTFSPLPSPFPFPFSLQCFYIIK